MNPKTASQFQKRDSGRAYADPTAQAVLDQIPPSMLYLCTPLRGDFWQSFQEMMTWYKKAEDDGYLPVSPLLCIPQLVQAYRPDLQRYSGRLNYDIIKDCQRAWVCGDIPDEDVRSEVNNAIRRHIPVDYVH